MPVIEFFTNIILPLALPKTYTFSVPEPLIEFVMPGKRAIVQFGEKRYYTGIIYQIHNNKPTGYETKDIISVLDEKPLVNAGQLKLWEWIAGYYCCTLGEVFKAALPAGLKLESETNIVLNTGIEGFPGLNEEE